MRYAQKSAWKQSIANTLTNNKTYLQSLIQKRQKSRNYNFVIFYKIIILNYNFNNFSLQKGITKIRWQLK